MRDKLITVFFIREIDEYRMGSLKTLFIMVLTVIVNSIDCASKFEMSLLD